MIFHAKGPDDYIKLRIVNGDQLFFQYQAGSGPIGVTSKTAYKLSDSKYVELKGNINSDFD